MRQSELFIKTFKQDPKDEVFPGIKFLRRGGFVGKVGAGIYNYLPLGKRVLDKIEAIVRQGMKELGGVEILMPALQPSENWKKTGRWDGLDILYKIKSRAKQDFALGPTHEEIIVPLVKEFLYSYKDLPVYLYQIQTKFRDEPRARSGLVRAKEFIMKDLYSFHRDEKDTDDYYEKVGKVYKKIFAQIGLKTIQTKASGGTFSKFSDEFQAVSETGEDTVYFCKKCVLGINKEIFEGKCLECGDEKLDEFKTIEVGNIFKLKTKYSEAFDLKIKDADGSFKTVLMGCYGIGISRAMGAVAEIFNDKNGLLWPEGIAPFKFHLLNLSKNAKRAEKIYRDLQNSNIEVLYDDREEKSNGEKLVEADLLGLPYRLVMSDKLKEGEIELRKRGEKEVKIVLIEELLSKNF